MASSIYTTGGTVQAGCGVYISRQADSELLELCRNGAFAYVLTPRQLGKSSLMVRTSNQLQSEGIETIVIDLTEIGTQLTVEQWYVGVLTEISDQLDLETDVMKWWENNSPLGLTQRLTRFFGEIVLQETENSIIVFIDEIDTTLSLNFTDDFFAAIRFFYNARANNSAFSRLSFVLFGVATPSDLIRDSKRTPFNIGQEVKLDDFTYEEALPLADGLEIAQAQATEILNNVLDWTGGHPYLTQKTLQIISEEPKAYTSRKGIDQLIEKHFFVAGDKSENNLRFVRNMLLERTQSTDKVLNEYKNILKGKDVYDEEDLDVKTYLKLSGIVKSKDGKLIVRNPIYQKVFDHQWIKKSLVAALPDRRLTYLSSLLAASIILVLRSLGLFVGLDLAFYDFMVRQKPSEGTERRVLVVAISESDLIELQRPTPSDAKLSRAIRNLQLHEPRVIGVDLYRELPQGEGRQDLMKTFEAENLIAIRKLGNFSSESIPAPSAVEPERIGFNDIPFDYDGFIRRHLLFAEDQSQGSEVLYSFGLRLALSYLKSEDIVPLESHSNPEYMELNGTTFAPIDGNFGGYHNIDDRGYQVILQYHSLRNSIQRLSFSEVLKGEFPGNMVRDRIIIIGTTAPSSKDFFHTPIGLLPGVILHANATSQFLRSALDEKPLVKSFPETIEVSFVLVMSLFGVILVILLRSSLKFAVVIFLFTFGVYLLSFILFVTTSYWLPTISASTVLILSSTFALLLPKLGKYFQNHRELSQ